jgi:hypothetical protein
MNRHSLRDETDLLGKDLKDWENESHGGMTNHSDGESSEEEEKEEEIVRDLI